MSIVYPSIDPVVVSIGPVAIHWYGLMYLLGFGVAWGLARWRVKHFHLKWSPEQISDLIFCAAIGTILGGRIGYMLFYATADLIHHPLSIVKVWQGGMSFHGGLVGVITALYYFARTRKKAFFAVTDFVAPLVPLGLAAGRIGNFINGELWGRPTEMPWGMVFPDADLLPRHPSQLYECGLEGFLLFAIVWWYAPVAGTAITSPTWISGNSMPSTRTSVDSQCRPAIRTLPADGSNGRAATTGE